MLAITKINASSSGSSPQFLFARSDGDHSVSPAFFPCCRVQALPTTAGTPHLLAQPKFSELATLPPPVIVQNLGLSASSLLAPAGRVGLDLCSRLSHSVELSRRCSGHLATRPFDGSS